MARKLLPIKLVISFDSSGDFKDGILLYKLRVDGMQEREYKSISIKNMDFDKISINQILRKIRKHVKDYVEHTDDEE